MNRGLNTGLNKHTVLNGNTGLVNLGNTCYLNSTMQIISHIPELNNYLNTNTKYNNIIETKITLEWLELYNLMWSKNCIICPKKFLFYLRDISSKKNSLFSGNDQNDAVEYFYFIIDCFHNSLNNTNNLNLLKTNNNIINDAINLYEKSNNSIIHNLFALFTINIYLNDYTNELEFHKIEPSFTIELSIPNEPNITIEKCFEYTFKLEHLPDLWYDEKTKQNKKIKKHTKICYLPKILVIHLKRWDHNLKKNNMIVRYSNILQLNNFTAYIENNSQYELFGIINHQGSVMNGHYYSYIKKNNIWLSFNDEKITSINDIISPDNYCLFYRKIK